MSHEIHPALPGALSIREFCRWCGIGRTYAYEQIALGKLRPRKLGRRTLIPFAEAQRWLDDLPNASGPATARALGSER